MSTHTTALLLVALLLLTACATGPVSGPVLAGGAAILAVFDQMLVSGAIDPQQYVALTQGVGALQTSVAAVQEAQSGTLSVETAATAAGGLTAAVLGGIRVWRGPATKKA